MIENTFGNKALEKEIAKQKEELRELLLGLRKETGTIETKESLENIAESIQSLKSEIVNDIEEMGGEEEFDAELYKDRKLAEKQKILKENILKIIYALGSIAIGSAFADKAFAQAEGADYMERLKSMISVESLLAVFSFLTALMATFSIKEEDKNENLDQV